MSNLYTNAAVALALAAVIGVHECPLPHVFDGEVAGDAAVRFENSRAWAKYGRRRLDSYPGQKGRRNRRKAV